MHRIIIALVLLALLPLGTSQTIFTQDQIEDWQGNMIPLRSANPYNGNFPYRILENNYTHVLQRLDDTLILQKNSYTQYAFYPKTVSMQLNLTKGLLNSLSTQYGANYYIVLPIPLHEDRFLWDNKKPIVLTNYTYVEYEDPTYDIIPQNDFWFSRYGNNILLWYNQEARDMGAYSSSNIYFNFDSYVIYSNSTSWDGIVIGPNMTVYKHTGGIGLNDNVPDYVSRWMFDNISSTYVFDQGDGNPGTCSNMGGSCWSVSSTSNPLGMYNAVQFHWDDNSYIGVAHNQSLAPGNITYTLWGYHDWDDRAAMTMLAKHWLGGYRIEEGSAARNEVACWAKMSGGESIAQGAVSGWDWKHYACTYDGSTLKLYINTTLADFDGSYSGPIVYTYNNSLIIGGESGTGSIPPTTSQWEGLIDDVRIYNRALNQSEISSIYNNTHKSTEYLETGILDAGNHTVWQNFTATGWHVSSNVTYKLWANASNDSISWSGWQLINDTYALNDKHVINESNATRYNMFRLNMTTTNLAQTDHIQSIILEILILPCPTCIECPECEYTEEDLITYLLLSACMAFLLIFAYKKRKRY